ncbi:MAG: NHL repeat-containing protein [Acidobacteriaceae bacterium]|nr:NHL repeat-containing protein [Acidobacteriaceae bacterium]
MKRLQSLSLLVLSYSASALLAGCAFGNSSIPAATTQTALGTIQGSVFGGRQPIQNAKIYIYAASTTAYGGASTSLMTSATGNPADSNGNYYVLTNQSGAFSVTGDYTCTAGTQVYIYSLGGEPTTDQTNDNAGLMAALGTCPSSGTMASVTPKVYMSEVSTVAMAYAVAGFAVDSTHIGAPATSAPATAALARAFAASSLLYDISGGNGNGARSVTPNGNGVVPQTLINSLANTLAACVNSTGADSYPCGTALFGAVKSAGTSGTTATDTATEAIYIAHNPGVAVSTVYDNITSTPPYAPSLSSQPNDFTVAIRYTDSNISAPSAVAIDASGDAWIANKGSNSITELSPLGVPTTFTGSLSSPSGIAIDASGNPWVSNSGTNSVTKFSSGTPTQYTLGTGSFTSIAIDGSGYIWASSSANAVYKISSTGTLTASSSGAQTSTLLSSPVALAFDNYASTGRSNDVYIANSVAGSGIGITVVQNTPRAANLSYTRAGAQDGWAVAFDSANNIWIANSNNTLTALTDADGYITTSAYSGGGLSDVRGLAIDGAGVAWTANSTGNSVSQFTNAGVAVSPTTGYVSDGTAYSTPSAIAADNSGNLWITNSGNNSVVELIGASTPVVTPLSLAASSGYAAGTKP